MTLSGRKVMKKHTWKIKQYLIFEKKILKKKQKR